MITVSLQVGSRYPVDRKKLRQHVIDVLTKHGKTHVEVSVSIVGARRMIELNEGLMKHEGITDFLSFPQKDPEQPTPDFLDITDIENKQNDLPFHIGDVVVCYPEAVREAMRYGNMVDDRICFLVEHGLMHLMGFHHD